MSNVSRSLVLSLAVVCITALVPIFGCPSPGDGQSNLSSRIEALEAQVADLEGKLAYIQVKKGIINDLRGPHLIIEGCNVHIRSGSGDTYDSTGLSSRGNLVIGYNEVPMNPIYGRTGSHNLIIGSNHEYASYGGFVAGTVNAVTGPGSSVSGGAGCVASGSNSSISGGRQNVASGQYASVSGGFQGTALGVDDWVAGTLFQDH